MSSHNLTPPNILPDPFSEAEATLFYTIPAKPCVGTSAPSSSAPVTVANAMGEALYAQLTPLVRRLIRQYGKTPEMRQDIEGELYCRFYALLEAYDPERGVPLRPYLIRQLTAAAYAYARQQWNLEKRLQPLEEKAETTPQLATEDPTPSWIHVLSQEQMFAGLPQALAALPTRQRQVVILRYYEDYSFEEIAEALNTKVATARSLLRHGLNKLRTSLAHLSQGEN